MIYKKIVFKIKRFLAIIIIINIMLIIDLIDDINDYRLRFWKYKFTNSMDVLGVILFGNYHNKKIGD